MRPEAPAPGPRPVDGPLVDRFGRVHTYLRVSVTDRCNYRCRYCMPAEGLAWMPRDDLLTYEEIVRIVRVLAGCGIRKVRLTGGEPTVRRDLLALVSGLAAVPGITDLAMTTNGTRLASLARPLREAGLHRVNVSLDDLDPDVFRALTRGGDVREVLDGLAAARAAGLGCKVNAVIVAGVNDLAPARLVAGFRDQPDVEIRFIEAMPFERVDPSHRHLAAAAVREALGPMTPLPPPPHGGPATRFRLASGQVVGFVSPITEHFCHACNRLRLQADGHLRTCLSREAEPSLRDLIRGGPGAPGASDADLERVLRDRVWGKVAGHDADRTDAGFRPFEGVMTSVGG